MANIPYVLAELDYQRRTIDSNTVEGLKQAIVVRTGNKELAEQVASRMATEAKLAAIKQNPMVPG